jgi:hypothetical protein
MAILGNKRRPTASMGAKGDSRKVAARKRATENPSNPPALGETLPFTRRDSAGTGVCTMSLAERQTRAEEVAKAVCETLEKFELVDSNQKPELAFALVEAMSKALNDADIQTYGKIEVEDYYWAEDGEYLCND